MNQNENKSSATAMEIKEHTQMDYFSKFRLFVLMTLLTTPLCMGCSSSPALILTSEDTDIERLDELFTEFTATYQFSHPVERHPVLGTLRHFRIDRPDEPIPLAPAPSSWTETEMAEATRQFIIEWHELLGLDLTTLVEEVQVARSGTLSNGAGWYYIKFRQIIDNYLSTPNRGYGITCYVSDDGFLWNLTAWVIPNIDLPRVKNPPSSKTVKKMKEKLIGRTLTPRRACGELYVTHSTVVQFRETELKIEWETHWLQINVAYSLTVQERGNPSIWWVVYFDAVTGEYISSKYGLRCH